MCIVVYVVVVVVVVVVAVVVIVDPTIARYRNLARGRKM